MADIPALKQAFATALDIHAMTASQVFGVPVEGMDPMVRRKAKAINFGIILRHLRLRPRGTAPAFPERGPKAYIGAYFWRYPGIRIYMGGRTFARGYV